MELFSNYSFTEDVKYNRFPIHLDLSSLVFVEVEGKKLFFNQLLF